MIRSKKTSNIGKGVMKELDKTANVFCGWSLTGKPCTYNQVPLLLCFSILVQYVLTITMDFLIDGMISLFCPDHTWAGLLTLLITYLLNLCKTLRKYLFGHTKDHGQFLHCQCPRPKLGKFRILPLLSNVKYVISGNLSKNV